MDNVEMTMSFPTIGIRPFSLGHLRHPRETRLDIQNYEFNGDLDNVTFSTQPTTILSNASWNVDEMNFSYYDSSPENETILELPIDMRFSDGNLLSIIVYSILMFFSAIGNIFILWSIIKIRMKTRLNRVNLLLMHLAIADLFVTFFMMPLEIGWNYTVSWKAGDLVCRIMAFFRTFGLYLSGFMISCISFDRYFAVLKPLTMPEANKRGRVMIYMAWFGSVICSLPQAWVFHLERHPVFTWYEQCITVNTFSSEAHELAYNFFGFTFMYAFPMVAIIFCYISILYEIHKVNSCRRNGEELRRSSMEALSRAKSRTLKMTMIIVITFFFCWTPYNIMSLWYWFDKQSAYEVDQRIQKGLFLFACTNAVVNPMVYGLFHIRSSNRRKSEHRIRQTLLANNCRLERIDRPPYGVRVRWKPRDCLCPANSAGNSSSENSKLNQGQIPLINRDRCHNHNTHPNNQNPNSHSSNRRTRATSRTKSTALGDNLYGSQRKRTTVLMPLTQREFNRHVPQGLGLPCDILRPVKAVVANNNNDLNSDPSSAASGVRNGVGKLSNSSDCARNGSKEFSVCTHSLFSHRTGSLVQINDLKSNQDTSLGKNKELNNSLQFDLDLEDKV